jgi:FAD/FMN-containing dehydrogenase
VPYLEYEHGNAVRYMKEVKKLFDPKGIMNPGKKFKWEGAKCGGEK